ncbi:PAS domain-containing protein [Ferruginibacter albus]|uniref:PAS domain-containing protein n=1 Tax=Ferruginibacter albus TaxID=2875540 RepID=UPI001CC4ACF6|nr:PAS domain-containing protein [Ferruginibacter albus]UAY51540.1 PAS domain-containing protein [Ferruginibacter albus]
MSESELSEFYAKMNKRSDKLVNYYVISLFFIGLLLSFFFNTWPIGIFIGGISLIAYYSARYFLVQNNLCRYVLSVIFGVFTIQFLYQMNGMIEMYFFAFIGSIVLIWYRNWKLQIPLAIVMVLNNIVLSKIEFSGWKYYFAHPKYAVLQTYGHTALSIAVFCFSGILAHQFKKSAQKKIQQGVEIGKNIEAEEQSEVLIAMSQSLKAANEHLTKAHNELKKLFENIEEAFFSFSVDYIEDKPCFTALQMSPACTKIYGYEPQDFVSNSRLWQVVIVKEHQGIIEKNISKLLIGKSLSLEYKIIHTDKTIRWVQTKINPTLNKDRVLVRIDGITTDITEKKLVEESLQKSEANLRNIFENTSIAYVLINADLSILSFNQQAAKIVTDNNIGDRTLMEGENILNYFQEERKALMKARMENVLAGNNISYEINYEDREGDMKWYSIQLFKIAGNNNEALAINMSITDITERKNAEMELKKRYEKIAAQEKLMKGAEKLAHFGSWQNNFLTNEVTWSDEAFRVYGYEPNELPPTYSLFIKHVHPDDVQYVNKTMEDAVKYHDTQELSFRIIDTNNAVKYIQAALIIERDEQGNVVHVLGFKQDITDKVMLEERLQEERKQQQKQITEAVITAQEKEHVFLGEELHDNINPTLATVKLYLSSLNSGEIFRKDLVVDSIGFLNMAMDEIRSLSKSLVPPSLKAIGLLDALNDFISSINKVNDISFRMNCNSINDELLDEKLTLAIFRIVQEQVNNILKHAQADKVTITIYQDIDKLQLIVEDNGVGFDTTQKSKGVGLQNIVSRADLFNGNVAIKSSPGKGCKLTVDFKIPKQFINERKNSAA